MNDNNAFNLYAAINAIRKDIAEGKTYTDEDMQYIYVAIRNFSDMCNEMEL